MKAILTRSGSTDEGTFGTLQLPDFLLSWVSLELPDRNNSPEYSSIKIGVYRCELRPTSKWSPRNGVDLPDTDHLLYQVLAVPDRDLIKIHAATWAGDVKLGWDTDLLGCIAPGKRVGALVPPEVGKEQSCILESRVALTEFMRATGGQPLELTIADAIT